MLRKAVKLSENVAYGLVSLGVFGFFAVLGLFHVLFK